MGQGYSLTTLSAGSAGIDVPELADLSYEKSLGDARFMKSIRAKHRDGLVVTKVVMKPYASLKFASYITSIMRERKILAGISNALGYHRALETSSNGYLVRQYVYSSIYDRLSTRPFLEDIEKKWLAFQLLCAVRDCHAQELYHGDIKTENVLVTSWNWLYLADFSSSFKPTYLPEDNPADFSFFFDISGRRTCYLAPERFLRPGEDVSSQGITWAMDIFSVGCVIAELFLENPIFSLSQLFKYRKGEYDPVQMHVSRIEDPDIRELVSHMIQLEPESRFSADEYLNFWRQKAFPEYFYSFLHQYMHLITDPSSGRASITAGGANLGESDERIDRVYYDFDKISYLLGWEEHQSFTANKDKASPNQLFPLTLDLPEKREVMALREAPMANDGSLLFLSIVTSALRSTARATARLRACELLLAFGERLTDEAKLDRVLPYVMTLVHDPSDLIKITALRTVTQLLAIIPSTSPVNAYIFPEYILPRLEALTLRAMYKPSPLIRATYASCLATLAHSASRFLDVVQALRAEGSLPSIDSELDSALSVNNYHNLYDDARVDLIRFFETETKALLTDTNANVRRAFLGSVSSLCVFLGSAKANDVILSHLNTYLNDKDWKLKSSFFETIVGVATYVGATNLEEFILPLMIQALSDTEEVVVEKVLRSLAIMSQLGLFQRSRTWTLMDLVGRFTMHPNTWVREAAVHFVSCAAKYLSVADCHCIARPMIKPYMRVQPSSLKELDLLDALKKPLPRNVLEIAMAWATRTDKGVFWKSVQQRLPSFMLEDRMPIIPAEELRPNALSRVQRNEEDNGWISKLRNAGMSGDDEMKFMALRDYIWRTAQRKTREANAAQPTIFNEKVMLKDVKVDVQTVFFEHQAGLGGNSGPSNEKGRVGERHQTISEALNEAYSPMIGTAQRGSTDSSLQESERALDSSQRRSAGLGLKFTEPDKPVRERSLHQRATYGSIDTADTASIMSSDDGLGHLRHNHALSRKGSAMNLMQRSAVGTKAVAEISTSDTTAIGEVDAPQIRRNPTKVVKNENLPPINHGIYREAHSYTGRDPNVLKHLDLHYADNYPHETVEFGPKVTPIHKRTSPIRLASASDNTQLNFRGTLVALFGEHMAAVRRVAVSPDHSFFITGSDDGTVRIWDCSRLERNLAHRSRQVYKHPAGAKITSLCFVENTHCFISTWHNGCVHVVKVDVVETSQGTSRFGKLKLLRTWQLPTEDSYAVWSEHYKHEDQSTLVIATNTSQIYALDLKNMAVLYVLENPVQHGTLTCFCLDSQKHWLLVGTSHGVLDLWDLRFRVRLRSWMFAGASPVCRILLHPSSLGQHLYDQRHSHEPTDTLICIAGGTNTSDVTIWNLNKMTCNLAFHSTSTDAETSASMSSPPYPRRHGMTQTFTLEALEILSPAALSARFAALTSTQPAQDISSDDIRALAIGLPMPLTDPTNPLNSTKKSDAFLISAGPDRRIRFWNLANPAASRVVSGLTSEELQPKFVAVEPTTMASATVWEERRQWRASEDRGGAAPPAFGPASRTSAEAAAGGEAQRRANVGARRTGESGAPGRAESERDRSGKTSKTTAISEQQQLLLRSHLDAVLDVAIVEWPTRMVVSVDRSGMVYVFS